MGTTAYGGKGSKGRAANGDWPVGAASCRRDHHTMVSCQNPLTVNIKARLPFTPCYASMAPPSSQPPASEPAVVEDASLKCCCMCIIKVFTPRLKVLCGESSIVNLCHLVSRLATWVLMLFPLKTFGLSMVTIKYFLARTCCSSCSL